MTTQYWGGCTARDDAIIESETGVGERNISPLAETGLLPRRNFAIKDSVGRQHKDFEWATLQGACV